MRAPILLLGLLVSCTHVRTEGKTAEEHRNEAAIHLETAQKEKQQYDPSKTMRPAPRGPGSTLFVQTDVPFEPYNPSDEHMQAADGELAEAAAHLAAAKKLEAFEDKACTGLSEGERSACPLFASSVRRVEWVKDGFKITFKKPGDAAPTFARLNCHLAYAVATGFDRPSCPLFIKGTTVRKDEGDSVVFAGASPEVASALRTEARRLWPPAVTAPR